MVVVYIRRFTALRKNGTQNCQKHRREWLTCNHYTFGDCSSITCTSYYIAVTTKRTNDSGTSPFTNLKSPPISLWLWDTDNATKFHILWHITWFIATTLLAAPQILVQNSLDLTDWEWLKGGIIFFYFCLAQCRNALSIVVISLGLLDLAFLFLVGDLGTLLISLKLAGSQAGTRRLTGTYLEWEKENMEINADPLIATHDIVSDWWG